MRTFATEQVSDGIYQILTGVVHEENNLLVVTRGKRVQLVEIPVSVVHPGKYLDQIKSSSQYLLLVIESMGGFRVPRVCLGNSRDVNDISAYEPLGGTTRPTDTPGIPGYS